MLHDAFHFLRWCGTGRSPSISVLLGISAGATTPLGAAAPQGSRQRERHHQATAILAPVSVVLGLLILIFHLARPWTFWKLMFHYQFDSVMSMGSPVPGLHGGAVCLAGGGVSTEIETLRRHLLQEKFAFVDNLIAWLARIERLLAPLLLLLAVLLGPTPAFCCRRSRPIRS